MKAIKLLLIASFMMSLLTINALANTDNKYYSEFAFKHKLNDKFDLYFTPEVRFKNDMGHSYYQQYRIGTTFHADKHLDLAAAYRYIFLKDTKGDWSNSDTQYIEMIAIPKTKLGGFNLSDANKLEYRFIENSRDRWVYRNLLTAAYPIKIADFEFSPYVSNEAYYDFEIEKINLNWVTVGVNKKLAKNLTVGLYYRDETSRVGTTSKWATSHILGSNLSVDF